MGSRKRLAMSQEGEPAGAKVGHHYRTIRRVHPNGKRVRVVLETRPNQPGEIVEMDWEQFRASQSNARALHTPRAIDSVRNFLFGKH
jgi:hypothetical protein